MVFGLQKLEKKMDILEKYAANLAAKAELERQIAVLEKENEDLQPAVQSALISSDTMAAATAFGILSISDDLSVSAVDDTLAVSVARQHGVKISTRSPEYVHPQTLKSAILKKQIPFSAATKVAVVVTKSKITLK